MKFVCRTCERFMDYQDIELPAEQSLGITFACEGCNASFSMVTNAGETQMVKALGVTLGGREAPASAFELTQGSLKQEVSAPANGSNPPANAPAEVAAAPHPMPAQAGDAASLAEGMEASMGKCPFANRMAVDTAHQERPDDGTVQWSDGALRRLQNVPGEIRPIARQLIEGMARDKGTALVDDGLMDEARDTFM